MVGALGICVDVRAQSNTMLHNSVIIGEVVQQPNIALAK